MSRVVVERIIPWRGSITDLATDVADLLTSEEGQKLIAELERFQQQPHLGKWAGSGHVEGALRNLVEVRSASTGCKGPIETELRQDCWQTFNSSFTHMTGATWRCVFDAIQNLRLNLATDLSTHWEDVISEAIEAAESLAL